MLVMIVQLSFSEIFVGSLTAVAPPPELRAFHRQLSDQDFAHAGSIF